MFALYKYDGIYYVFTLLNNESMYTYYDPELWSSYDEFYESFLDYGWCSSSRLPFSIHSMLEKIHTSRCFDEIFGYLQLEVLIS